MLGWEWRAPQIIRAEAGEDYQPSYPPESLPAPGEWPGECPPPLVELVRIEAGIPRWGRELHEDTLPPEAGLDRTHIDYAKGCYIGQEVISRIKSVGHVNRRLTGFISAPGEPLQAGWSVFAPGDSAKPVGELTSAAWSFALAKPVALGYLRRGSPSGALLARPPGSDTPTVEVTPAELPLVVHFPSP
jgi:folate-binding protein YgfZ